MSDDEMEFLPDGSRHPLAVMQENRDYWMERAMAAELDRNCAREEAWNQGFDEATRSALSQWPKDHKPYRFEATRTNLPTYPMNDDLRSSIIRDLEVARRKQKEALLEAKSSW